MEEALLPRRKAVQFSDIHDNTSRLVIGGLSLLGLLTLGVTRIVSVFKRKDVTVPRYNSRMVYSSSGSAAAPAPVSKRRKTPKDACEPEARPWRGIFVLEQPQELVFSLPIEFKTIDLPEWEPQIVISPRLSSQDE